MIQLSTLICSIKGREKLLERLLGVMLYNGDWKHVTDNSASCKIDCYTTHDAEIIVATDDCKISIGEKRNRLVKLSSGLYVSEVDDDDYVELDYQPAIIQQTPTKPDCIVFDAMRYVDNVKDRLVKYGIEYGRDYNTPTCYFRLPNHLMAYKREIALLVPYAAVSFGEDSKYALDVFKNIETQLRIDRVLYHYLFTTEHSTSGKPQRRL